MKQRITSFPYEGLFSDYCGGVDLREFFPLSPWDERSYLERARHLDRRPSSGRPRLAEALVRYNQDLDAYPAAVENARLLADPKTLVVVTGQQTGLFTGPLITVYKAVTAIALARKLSTSLNRPVVPVFWVCSDDHDFEEIRGVTVASPNGDLEALDLGFEPPPRRPVGWLDLPPATRNAVYHLEQMAGSFPHGSETVKLLSDTLERASSPAEWFARIMARLFTAQGLVLLDPLLPEVRDQARPVFEAALKEASEIERAIREAGAKVRARGYEPSLRLDRDQLCLFRIVNQERRALFLEEGAVKTREGDRWTLQEVLRAVSDEPGSLAPNVITRPLLQDNLLPTLAQVSGPGELSYLCQMADVYRLFGLEMPVIFPRVTLTLIPPRVQQVMAEYGIEEISPDALVAAEERARHRLDDFGIDRYFDSRLGEIEAVYARMQQDVSKIDPDLVPLTRENLERVKRQLEYLREKAWRFHRRKHRRLLKDIALARSYLRPTGGPQEKVLGIVTFLMEAGLDLPGKLVENLILCPYHHRMVYLS